MTTAFRIKSAASLLTKLRFAPGGPGPSGPIGPPGETGPVGEGDGGLFFLSRSGLANATVAADIKSVRTASFSTIGDRGDGLHYRLSAAPASPSNPAYTRSLDRYKADGIVDATHGGYWGLVPTNGEIRIEQVGGKADFNGSTGTDNLAPLLAAIDYQKTQPNTIDWLFSNAVIFGLGDYWFSQTHEVHRTCRLSGVGGTTTVSTGQATQLWFPADTTGFIIHGRNTAGEGSTSEAGLGAGINSILERLIIRSLGGTDLTKQGILARARFTMRDCTIMDFPGRGVFIRASINGGTYKEGNANGWRMDNVMVDGCWHGFHVWGTDTNAGVGINCETKHCRGTGILDESTLGNLWAGSNVAGYGKTATGDFGVAVRHSGRLYSLVSNFGAVEGGNPGGTTTPGTNDSIWLDMGADPGPQSWTTTWSSGAAYFPTLPILCTGNNSSFVQTYVELGHTNVHVEPPASISFGVARSDRYSAGLGVDNNGRINSNYGFGRYVGFDSGTVGYTNQGSFTEAYIGRGTNDPTIGSVATIGLEIWGHKRATEAGGPQGTQIWSYRYYGGDLAYGPDSAGYPVFKVTTTSTDLSFGSTFGTGVNIPNVIGFYDMALFDPNNGNNARRHMIRSAAPTTGVHARGEFVWNPDPSAGGVLGWSCVTTGTPGTWIAIPVPAS